MMLFPYFIFKKYIYGEKLQETFLLGISDIACVFT